MTSFSPLPDIIRTSTSFAAPACGLTRTTCRPECNPETRQSNVPGLYLAGVIIAGLDTNEIFIENGRFHGKQIVADIRAKSSRQ